MACAFEIAQDLGRTCRTDECLSDSILALAEIVIAMHRRQVGADGSDQICHRRPEEHVGEKEPIPRGRRSYGAGGNRTLA